MYKFTISRSGQLDFIIRRSGMDPEDVDRFIAILTQYSWISEIKVEDL